jgi:hypothetical protein
MNNVLIVDGENSSLEWYVRLLGGTNVCMYEKFRDNRTALKRVIKNNYSAMIISLDTDNNGISSNSLIRANCNIGKHTIVKYSNILQKMLFCLGNRDILDRVEFINGRTNERIFRKVLDRVIGKHPVPFTKIFDKMML